MINTIKKYEQQAYIIIFAIGLYFDFKIIEIIGIILFLLCHFRFYSKQKNLSNYLHFLFIQSICTAILIKTFITDFELMNSILFYFMLLTISFLIKTFLATKIHYNQKFSGTKAIALSLILSIFICGYFISLGNYPPNFSGDDVFIKENKFRLFYDNNILKEDLELISDEINEIDYLYERRGTTFKLTDESHFLKLQIYHPRMLWDEEIIDELFYSFQQSFNERNLSKKLRIILVARTILELKEKEIISS